MTTMTVAEKILKALEGASSKAPMSPLAIYEITALALDEINGELDRLYEQKRINYAHVNRGLGPVREVWPTGVILPASYAQPALRIAPTPPLRPAEVKQNFNITEIKQTFTEVKTVNPDLKLIDSREIKETNNAENKPTTKTIVDIVVLKNQITKQAIYAHFDSQSGYRNKAIKNLSALIINQTLKFDGEYVRLGDRANKFLSNHKKAALKVLPIINKNESASEEYEIPAFLRKDTISAIEPVLSQTSIKISYTNQKTIMLFGLADSPIELTKENSEALICFCAEMHLFSEDAQSV